LDKHATLLQEIGFFNHLHAENGSEAMAMVKNFSPDLLIVSQELPDISGLALLNLVRQHEDEDVHSIIVVYGEISERTFAKLGRLGVDAIIRHPYEDDNFKKHVLEILNQPLDVQQEQTEKLQEKCTVLIQTGKLEEALQACNDILEVDANAEVYYNKGYILSVRGHLHEALKSFKKAIFINGHHAKAFKQMGLIYQKLGRTDKAQDCLEYSAQLHLSQNQESEAEEILNTVLTLRPDTTNVYNSLGIIYRRQGRFDEAVKAYEKAIRVHPDDENIYFNLARAYMDLNNNDQASQCLKKAISLNTSFTPAKDLLRAIELGLVLKAGQPSTAS
jgi:tetratricopeptide (TPR) repeat protein